VLTRLRRRPAMNLRNAAIIMGVLLVVGAVLGFALDRIRPAEWSASSDVLIRTWSVDSLLLTGQPATLTTADQADAATVAVSEPVLTRALRTLGSTDDWHELATTVTASPQASSHVVTITATGPDAATATARADAVANAFAAIRKEQLDQAARGLVASPTGAADESLRTRSQLLISSTQPVEVFRTAVPQQVSPSSTAPAAGGVVGLAVGALLVLGLSLGRPAVNGPRDAQRATGLPALDFDTGAESLDTGAGIARMLTQFDEDGRRGAVLLCPVGAEAEKAAELVADWARRRGYGTTPAEVLPEPTTAVLRTRPKSVQVMTLLLVAPQGTSREALRDAVDLLDRWRRADAVVVTS
jgi:capsular polysaccharide biosynthesis protein